MKPGASEFLAQNRIAVVGVSRSRGFGKTVLETLIDRGYDAVPINANADTINGFTCYRSLAQVPLPIDAVVTVVPPSQTLTIVDDCIRLGVRHLWMQQGSESKEAIGRAADAGINVIHHACILMYAQPRGIHRLHQWLHARFARD